MLPHRASTSSWPGFVPAIRALATKNVDARDKPGHDDVLVLRCRRPKLLRGHALPDMSDLNGKVAEYCRKSRLETLKSVNFVGIGPKFLAVQRHSF